MKIQSQNKHLKLLFTKGTNTFQAMLFGANTDSFCYNIGDVLDLAVTVQTNHFNGNYEISVVIKEMRQNGFDDDIFFKEFDNYQAYKSGRGYDALALTPTRSEVGEVYRAITQNGILEQKLINIFLNILGYAKTKIALDVLCDLKLIGFENFKYFSYKTTEKTNLLNSGIYSALVKECEGLDK